MLPTFAVSMTSLFERFQRLEREAGCFSFRIQGVPIWEWIRNEVFGRIQNPPTSQEAEEYSKLKSAAKRGLLFSRSLFYKNPYLCSESDVMFFGHRRTLEPDGLWWDHILDPLHEALDYEYMHFEEPMWGPDWNHRRKAKTENLRYLDLIKYAGEILKLIRPSISLSSAEVETLETIDAHLAAEFDMAVGVTDLAKDELATRKATLPLYRKLIQQVNPKIIIGSGNFINQKTFLEAAKSLGVPTVEFQHGATSDEHVPYSFCEDCSVTYFPDYIFTWGDFWKNCCHFPIAEDRIIPVGYPYLENRKEKYGNLERENKVIFLSQASIGKELSKYAIRIDDSNEFETIFKLHPSEYHLWENDYPWLKKSDINVVSSDTPPLYELFGKAFAQVGVYSSAIYEGLAFDLDTYLIDFPKIERMENLLQKEGIKKVSPDKLIDFKQDGPGIETSEFFKPNAILNFEQAIRMILRREQI